MATKSKKPAKPAKNAAPRLAKKPAKKVVARPPPKKAAPAAKKAAEKAPRKPAKGAKAAPPVEKPQPPRRVDPLVEALGAKSAKDRIAAAQKAEALGKKASPAVAHALVAGLEAPDAPSRKAALAALIALGPAAAPALPALASRIQQPGPVAPRGTLALALAKLDTSHMPAALPILAELLAVGAASEAALVQEVLALVPALGPHAAPLVPALLKRLDRADGSQAQAILAAIRAIGPVATDSLREGLQKAGGPNGAALVALLDGYQRAEDTLALGELTRAPDLQVRLAAVAALARRRAPEGLPDLLRALQDPSREVPGAALAALRNFDPEVVQPVLAAFLMRLRLDSPEARNRTVVTASDLGIAAFDEIGPLLLDALSDDDAAIRTRAAQGLQALAAEARAALPRLRAQRKDPSDLVRGAVEAAITAIEHASPR